MAEKRKLSLMLTTSFESQNTTTVVRLAEAALRQGHSVEIFMMCDGVLNSYDPRLADLMEKGVRITQCEHNAEERHISREIPIEQGSQYIFSTMLDEADRFVCLNN